MSGGGRPSGAGSRDLRLHLELGPSVPGALVRLLPAALVLLLVGADGLLAAAGGTAATGGLGASGVVDVLLLASAAVTVWRPALPAAPVVVALLGPVLLSSPDLLSSGAAGLGRLVVLLVGTHLLLRLTGLAAHTAWSARVETAVLARWLAPVLPVQAAVLALAAAVLAVRAAAGAVDGSAPGVLRLVAVVAVVVAVLVVAPGRWFRRLPS